MGSAIYIRGRKYNYWETYRDWQQAITEAKRHKKRNKCKYFILKKEMGYLFPETRYVLYLDKAMRLFPT